MLRPIALSLLVLSAAPAFAGSVPEEALKDAEAGYFHKALVIVEPLAKSHPQDAELQFRFGQALLGIRKADDAIAALKVAVALDPNNGVYHRELGQAYGLAAQQGFTSKDTGMFKMMGLANSMSKELETAVQLAPNDLESHVSLAEYYINAPGFFGGSFRKAHVEEDAIAKLDKVTELKVRAEEAGKQDDIAAGEGLYKQAIALDKTSGSQMALGMFYIGAKRYDDALKTFQDIEAKDPQAYGAWYQIGKTAMVSKNHYAEGIESLKQYLAYPDLPDTVPTLAWAHYRLGSLYDQLGHADLAKVEYQTATTLNEGDPDLASKLKDATAPVK